MLFGKFLMRALLLNLLTINDYSYYSKKRYLDIISQTNQGSSFGKKEVNISKISILTNCKRDSAVVRSSVRWFTLCFTSVTA